MTNTVELPATSWASLAYTTVSVLKQGLESEDAGLLMNALSLLTNLDTEAAEASSAVPQTLIQPITAFWTTVLAEEPSFDNPKWQLAAHTLVTDYRKAWLAWYDERRKQRPVP